MRAAKLGALTVLLATSCEQGGWRDDYNFIREGENVTLYGYGYTEWDMCGGSFAELDGHAGMIMHDLGVDSTSVFRWVSPHFMSLPDSGECPGTNACAGGNEALAVVLPYMHEVTHTITDSIGGDGCPRLIDEGLASYYDGPSVSGVFDPGEWWSNITLSLREAMEVGFEYTADFYAQGMRLVSYLAETYGPESIVALCEALPREPRLETWDAAVREVYGVPLDELIAAVEASPKCDAAQMRAKLWGCGGLIDYASPYHGSQYVVESGCDDYEATNGWLGTGTGAVLTRRVFVQDETEFEVVVRPIGHPVGRAPTYMITECKPCSLHPDVFLEIGHEFFNDVHVLGNGSYEIAVFFDRRDQVRLTMTAIE